MLETGKILQNRYRIEKQIGQGGMGSVYLATDERFNSTVAIKETLFTDDTYLKAFQREARLLNSLKHTALPKVSDNFIDENSQYIVMEFIAGEDLFEMIEQSGEAFPFEDVLIWADQLLDALEYLHGQENPVIHRDIKPQNLKLTSHGQVILLDFGLAKGNPTDANHQTAANSIFGYSRNYASLEQIQGTGTDPRSDIYSLAATLYHLVTGKPPADALTRVMMVLNEEKDPLQPAHLIHEQVPIGFSEALNEAMSLNANLRPQSASEMRTLLSGKEKVLASTRPDTNPAKAAGTNLYTQNTKLLLDDERPKRDSKQSGIKTEVLADGAVAGDSVKTKIAKPTTLSNKKKDTNNSRVFGQQQPNRLRSMMIAALGILLLAGTVVSMVYMFSPESSEANNASPSLDTNTSVANTSTTENTNTDVNEGTIDVALSDLNTNSDDLASQEELPPSTKEETPKVSTKPEMPTKETAASKKSAKGLNKNKVIELSDGDLMIKDGKLMTRDGVIINDKIDIDGIVFDENGITLKKPTKKAPMTKTPSDMEKVEGLTPEQKRKVINAIEKAKRDEKQKRLELQRQIDRNQRNRERRLPPPPRPPNQ
jgi:serine/threonine protein kinase